MKTNNKLLFTSVLMALQAGIGMAQNATINVDVRNPNHAISPTLFGVFLEDINLSIDGGLYPEQVRNRSFEDADTLCFWNFASARGKAMVEKADLKNMKEPVVPLNPVNRQFLKVSADGSFEVSNEGYWGVNVEKGEHYDFSIALRTPDFRRYSGNLKVALVDEHSKTLAEAALPVATNAWEYAKLVLTPSETSSKAKLVLSGEGQGDLYMDMVSLMPQKKWGKSGVRPDLGKALDDMRPTFFRFRRMLGRRRGNRPTLSVEKHGRSHRHPYSTMEHLGLLCHTWTWLS